MSNASKQDQLIHPYILLFMGIGLGALTTIFMLRNSSLFNLVISSKPENGAVVPTEKYLPRQPLLTMYGTVRTGKQLDRDYCAEGLYLVSEMSNGVEPTTTDIRLLKVQTPQGPALLEETRFVDKYVSVGSDVPLAENTCLALTCECEPSLFVDAMSEDIPLAQ